MDGEEHTHTDLAQWSKDARRRAQKAILHAVRQNRSAKQRFVDAENRIERVVEVYQATLLSGAHLPPMLSTLRITTYAVRLQRTALEPDRPDQGGPVLA